MVKFTYITLFPNLIKPYFSDSILKRAIDKNLINIEFFNPRDFSTDKHKKVDNYKAGGGAGLLMSPQPLFDTLTDIIEKENPYIIFTSPVGKKFNQNDAKRLASKKNIIFVCGRYEGIDERIIEMFADEILSIGDFILTGGELASLVMSDAIARNVENVLGNKQSLEEESFEEILLEAPAYTKPNSFRDLEIPKEFLNGNHKKIALLKKELSIKKTKFYRPDLLKNWKIINSHCF